MSIPLAILSLLRERPLHGYQIRGDFEEATGASWPLNIGQVYTTLARLQRDGLVHPREDDDGTGRQAYEISTQGREALETWWNEPVVLANRPRDELAIKLAMAACAGVDVRRVIQTQRSATMKGLQDLTRLKRDAAGPTRDDLAWSLVLENLRLTAEAELRWLDYCETTIAKVGPASRTTGEDPSQQARVDNRAADAAEADGRSRA